MLFYFWVCISYCLRAILSLRYRVEVKGLEKLTSKKLNRKGGILFLPNHPAHLDPLIVFLWLWPKFRMRPLVIEYIYNMPLLAILHKAVGSLMIPSFENGVNEWKVKRAEKSVREMAEGLKNNENFVLYPSGRLKSTAKELIGGASAAHELLKECPDVNVVLIRTTGLWGSSFSRALIGRSPDLPKTIWRNIKIVLKNFLFFTPRRTVLLQVEPNPSDFPWEDLSRITLNRYLENWYNRYPDRKGNIHEREPLTLVSYSCLREELPEVFQHKEKKKRAGNGDEVSETTRQKIYTEIRRILDKPDLVIKPEQNLAFDLGMDSLNIAEFIAFLTQKFDVSALHPEDLETVGTVLEIAEGNYAVSDPVHSSATFNWPVEKDRPVPTPPVGRTIPEAFLHICEKLGHRVALGDDVIGTLSYPKLKRAVLVLAQYFKRKPETHIAVMLPASVGAFIVILALQMAGKIPVMLNWTLGPRYLEEMIRISGAKEIVTSQRFLDRLNHVQFGSCLDRLVPLEQIRSHLTLGMKLKGAFLTRCSARFVARTMRLKDVGEDSPAVILFTSGTESAPKGVPLSHKNIIANQRSALQCINTLSLEVMYGILPPFHSFGFSVAGLLPILSGMRVAFYPDPTDSFALAEGIERWKITIFCAAPSFLKGLFLTAKKEQLLTVRYFVSGAEKAPQELFHRVAQLRTEAHLVEGYGITECSPIITINRPNLPPRGVGRLLPDMELCTIHLETQQLLPEGAEGEICVRGPNVFHGYLGNPRSPFIEIGGKKWYRTGDIGHLDKEGNLLLSGRLKRFTKLGGEMISLGAIEEVLVNALLQKGRIHPDIPALAIVANEKEGKPQLIVFATFELTKDEANQILQEGGFSNLVKIAQVKKIEDIPLLGAGKTDYRSLQALC